MTTDSVRAMFPTMPSFAAHGVRWLVDVPIADAIDRRNAPTMQVLFAFMAITLPISWAIHFSSMHVVPGMLLLAGMDLLTVITALVGIHLIRRGAFRIAVVAFLASLLLALFVTHAQLGYQRVAVDQTGQMLSLAIGGLVLGRRALWTVFGVLMLVFLAGFTTDAALLSASGQSPITAFHFAPSAAFSYFVIVLVLDRCITALRVALRESEAHRRALQQEIDERERMQARLLHAQKMETMGRLAAGVAHDFNNVLGVVMGYADARHRIDDVGDDPRQIARDMADALEGVDAAAQKGVELARRLLCFGRRDDERLVMLDAGQLLADMQPMLRRLLPRSIALTLHSQAVDAPVRVDRSQFELVALDIATNARDAMPEGGALHVVVRHEDDHVEIAFTDTGHGMSANDVANAFEPFFSTKPAGSGTGLGLATARSVVERAGGTVALDSAPGRGTTVRVRLPRASDQPTT
jgi:signal transduction histidine kinase